MPLITIAVCDTAASVRYLKAVWASAAVHLGDVAIEDTAPKPYEVAGQAEEAQLRAGLTAGEQAGPVAGLAPQGRAMVINLGELGGGSSSEDGDHDRDSNQKRG